MADYENPPNTFSSSITYCQNIPILFGIKNYSIWVSQMHFSLGDLEALSFIDIDLPRLAIEKFLAANIRFTGQTLSFKKSMMGDITIDLAIGTKIVKEIMVKTLDPIL